MTVYGTQSRSIIHRATEYYWRFTDVHANIRTAELLTRTYDSGAWAMVSFVVFLALTLVMALGTWYFDIQSTYNGLQVFALPMVNSLPTSVAFASSAIIALVTIAPMFLEIFASAYARAHIEVIKIMVFGFTIFDVVTDIPRATQTVNMLTNNASFHSLPGPIEWFFYWLLFAGMLLMATVGFQLATVIFAYVTFIWLAKATATDSAPSATQVANQVAAQTRLNNMKHAAAAAKIAQAQAKAAAAKAKAKATPVADDAVEVMDTVEIIDL